MAVSILKRRILAFIFYILGVIAVCIIATVSFISMKINPVLNGPGVTETVKLSNWFEGIKNTNMDTNVYVFDSGVEGGSILILGGTHANEPAGILSAIVMLENIKVETGKVFIIPYANNSAISHNDAMEGAPEFYHIDLPDGSTRDFRFGSRRTNPTDQWPDPTLYNHQSGSTLGGGEVSNLNRCYPGDPDGYPTEKLAYAIVQLIKNEKVDIVIDMHESSPEYPVNDAIVFHQNAAELAITAQMMLEMDNIQIRLEESPVNLRGLSHREIGDSTDAMVLLLEVANPSQGRLRGKTDEDLVVTGLDKFYVQAAKEGKLYAPYDENGYPISLRVARHITTIDYIIQSWNMMSEKQILIDDIPSYENLINDIGSFLIEHEG